MRASEHCINLIQKFEGYMSSRYYCAAGKPTIGYGHVILITEPELNTATLTKEEATTILLADVEKFEKGLAPLLQNISLKQCEYDAIFSLCYNIGINNFKNSTLLRLLTAGEFELAYKEFFKWNKITHPTTGLKVVNNGLSKRRAEEAELFINGF